MLSYRKIITVFFLTLFFACRSTGPVNKTHDAKLRPSDLLLKENKRVIRKGRKAARKEMRHRKRSYRHGGHYD